MFQILIVDDEHLILNGIRLMITDMLSEHFSIDIITANSALEALDFMSVNTPDLILSDIRMPVMDGFMMIEKIIASGYLGDIALLTSHADFEYARTAIRYGVIDFLLKPINEDTDDLFLLTTKQIKEIRAALSEQTTKSNAIIGQILNYIKEHYQKDISLDDIGDAIGLNPRYICTLLKKHTDNSYLTWLHMERIKVAKELLNKNNLTIEQIAGAVGYNSSTQLGRVFRKYENMSPSDYRDNLTTQE